jgi:hypothetical protein
MPIDGGELTFEDFEHCLRAVLGAMFDLPVLRSILTGEKAADVAVMEERARVA